MNIDISGFHVVTMISNPVGFKSRPELYRKFKKRIEEQGLTLWTCEIAQGERDFEVTQAGDPHVLQLRTVEELWHKENAINQMIERLPNDWKYVAWVDADVSFMNNSGPDAWYYQAVKALQTYEVVQLWQNCIDLGPNGETVGTHTSFVHAYLNGTLRNTKKRKIYGGSYAHPGYAWAMNRSVFDKVGGLYAESILGSGDNIMAYCMVGKWEDSIDKDVSEGYKESLRVYQARCERYIRRDIGYLPGTIIHDWHGKKKTRYYDTRWKILVRNEFDPYTDIKRDYQGLYQLEDHGDQRSINLRDDIRAYFRSRAEDSVDLE